MRKNFLSNQIINEKGHKWEKINFVLFI
jgi:hypothetical protein